MVQQFTYFGRSNAGNTSPANTLYGIHCAQNGTARAAHALNATVFPLNRFKPSYPWPVIPSINANDTTPSGTATYYPGWNVGNNAFAFPVASGANPIGSGGGREREDREPVILRLAERDQRRVVARGQ